MLCVCVWVWLVVDGGWRWLTVAGFIAYRISGPIYVHPRLAFNLTSATKITVSPRSGPFIRQIRENETRQTKPHASAVRHDTHTNSKNIWQGIIAIAIAIKITWALRVGHMPAWWLWIGFFDIYIPRVYMRLCTRVAPRKRCCFDMMERMWNTTRPQI